MIVARMLGAAVTIVVAIVAPVAAQAQDAVVDPVAAYVAAWNGAGPTAPELLTDDFVDRTTLLPLDRSAFAMQLGAWRSAFPDLRVSVVEQAGTPDRVVLRLRVEGTASDAAASMLPLYGRRIAIEQTEWLSIANGRLRSRQAFVDEWSLPAEWMFVPPPTMPVEPYVAETLAGLGAGRFLESIAVADDGRLFVSTGPDGGISVVEPGGRVTQHARVDVGPGGFMMCLAFDGAGALHATVNSASDDIRGVWRFDSDGRGARIAALPPGAVPNGIAIDGRGHTYVADSFGGVIWRIPAGGGRADAWLRHAWLTPRPLVGRFPGANGLQIADGDVYVSVSDRSVLLRVPIAQDGTAGEPVVHASGLAGDDFAVAPDGTLYVTTHPFDSVVRLTRDGRTAVVAGPAQGVVGPTAAAVGRDGSVYVVTDGGLYRPLPGTTPSASVVRLSRPRR